MTSVERRFITAALGAVAGFAAAFYLHPMMWWFGAALGGVVAWFAFDPKRVFRVAPLVAHNASSGLTLARLVGRTVWAIPGVMNRMRFQLLVLFVALLTVGFWLTLDRLVVDLQEIEVISTVSLLVSMGIAFSASMPARDFDEVGFNRVWFVFLASPLHLVIIPVVLLYFLVRFGPRLAFELALFSVRFVRGMYILTHSHERVLIVIDVMLGTAFGYLVLFRMVHVEMLPALFIASLVAGVLGIVHYKISETYVMPRLVSKNGN